MKRRIFTILLALVAVAAMSLPAYAATTQDVTVTLTPSYIAISNSPSTWTLAGITGSGKAAIDTVYYSNPLGDTTAPSATVVDGECRFTITNTSTVATDLKVNCSDFSGGDNNMTNSNDGSNGAAAYGAYSWYSGMTYSSKVLMKSSDSAALKSNLAATTDLKWGAEIETQTGAWAGPTSSTATMTIAATAH